MAESRSIQRVVFFTVALVCGLHAIAAAPPAPSVATATVKVRGPMIIAFLPPSVRNANDDASATAAVQVRFAMDDTAKCLRPKKVAAKLVYADRIVLNDGKSSEVFPVKELGQTTGAILVEPGRKAAVTYAETGQPTIQNLLPSAAAAYWNEPKCKESR